MVLLVCLGFAAAAGLTFAFLSGWPAYGLAVLMIGLAAYLPALCFRENIVFPLFEPLAVACLTSAGAATYQHFFVRRQLRHSESERSRYQQAIHWAAHEMRTPLTAIQGSSEIMTRLFPARGEAPPVERDDQLGIEAPLADHSDVPGCGASGRRSDGNEARAVRRGGYCRNLPEACDARWRNASKLRSISKMLRRGLFWAIAN